MVSITTKAQQEQIMRDKLLEFCNGIIGKGDVRNQAEIAEKIGVSPQYLSGMIKGGKPITLKTIYAIYEKYNYHMLIDIFGEQSTPKSELSFSVNIPQLQKLHEKIDAIDSYIKKK